MKKFFKSITIFMFLHFLHVSVALAADQVYFYVTDPAGTPVVMSDATGSVVWRADYMPFGEETINQATVPNNKMFVGKEKDNESGLYNFGSRSENSLIGRFTSPDPIGPVDPRTGQINQHILNNPQRLNLYTYGLNNPYRYVDADGRMATEIGAGVGTLVAPGPGTAIGAGAGFIIDLGATALVSYGVYKAGEAIYNANKDGDTNKENVGKSEQEKENTPTTKPGNFDKVKGSKAKRDKDTGEIWEKDNLHKDHYEVYKNKKKWEQGERDRSVWENGAPKDKF